MAAAAGAGKRIVRSSVEWGKFVQRVPKEEVSNFQSLKARSDTYVARVQSLPETLPSLEWTSYKRRAPAMSAAVDQLQKQYEALQIPYPKADAQLSAVDNQQKQQIEDVWRELRRVEA